MSCCSARGCHPAATFLDLHKDKRLADKAFPAWSVKEPPWEVNIHLAEQGQPQTWLCGDRWPVWQSCWQSCAQLCVCAQAALHSACAKRGSAWLRSHLQLQWDSRNIFTLIPIWKISHLIMIFFFFFSPRKGKHEKPVASGSLLSFLWHFHPENT